MEGGKQKVHVIPLTLNSALLFRIRTTGYRQALAIDPHLFAIEVTDGHFQSAFLSIQVPIALL